LHRWRLASASRLSATRLHAAKGHRCPTDGGFELHGIIGHALGVASDESSQTDCPLERIRGFIESRTKFLHVR
jgi:hypothetical protein